MTPSEYVGGKKMRDFEWFIRSILTSKQLSFHNGGFVSLISRGCEPDGLVGTEGS